MSTFLPEQKVSDRKCCLVGALRELYFIFPCNSNNNWVKPGNNELVILNFVLFYCVSIKMIVET